MCTEVWKHHVFNQFASSFSSPINSAERKFKDGALLKALKRFKKVNNKRTRKNSSLGWSKVVIVHNGYRTALKLEIWSWRLEKCLSTWKRGRWGRRLPDVHRKWKIFRGVDEEQLGRSGEYLLNLPQRSADPDEVCWNSRRQQSYWEWLTFSLSVGTTV